MVVVKRFFIALIGGTLLLIGIALLVLPGPGVVIILAGLALLASEFLWARKVMHRCKSALTEARTGKWFDWSWGRRARPGSRPRSLPYEVPPAN